MIFLATLIHCTGSGTSSDPYIYTTPEGFYEAIVSGNDKYVEAGVENLMVDCNVYGPPPHICGKKSKGERNYTV